MYLLLPSTPNPRSAWYLVIVTLFVYKGRWGEFNHTLELNIGMEASRITLDFWNSSLKLEDHY